MEFILVAIEEAGWDYEELSQVSTQIDNFLQEDDLSVLEKEALTEISEEVCDKLENIAEAMFEEQIDNEMEARAFLFNHIHYHPHINLDEEEEDEEEEEEEEEEEDSFFAPFFLAPAVGFRWPEPRLS